MLVDCGISVVRLVSSGDLFAVLDCAMGFLVGYNFVGALKELKADKSLDASAYNELLKLIIHPLRTGLMIWKCWKITLN